MRLRDEIRPMLQLGLPLIFAELGWMCMGIVDTIMVGRLPNSAVAIGATSLGGVVFYTVAISGNGLLLGLDTLVSQAFGAKNIRECHRWLVDGLFVAFLLAPLLMLIIYGLSGSLGMLGINREVLASTVPYLRTLNWSVFPLMLYFGFRRYLQAMNIVRPVTYTLVSANLLNLFFNWLLVYGNLGAPRLGVVGSAWSTGIARVYMAGMLLAVIFHYDRKLGTDLLETHFRAHWRRMYQLIRLGLPAATQIGLEIGVFAYATALIGKLDAVSLAAHQIALNSASFTYMVPLGISSAAAVRVGQALGRRDPNAASQAGWAGMVLACCFMSCSAIVFLSLPRQIGRIFTPDRHIIEAGVALLAVAAAFQLFDGLQSVAIGALRGAGDTRTPMFTSVLAYWAIGLPLGWYLCFRLDWGARGIWLGLCLGLVIVAVVLVFYWRRMTQHMHLRMPQIAAERT